MVLSLIETALGIMAVSLTSVYPLFNSWRAHAPGVFGKRTDSDLESATVGTSKGSSIISDKAQPTVSYHDVQPEAMALRRLGILPDVKPEEMALRRLGVLPDVSSESLVLVEEIQECPPVSWDEAYNRRAMTTITESIDGEDDIK